MVNSISRFFKILLVVLLSFLPIITLPGGAEALRYAQAVKALLVTAGGAAVVFEVFGDLYRGLYRRFNWTRSDLGVLVLAVWTLIILSLRYTTDGVVEKRLELLLVGIVWFFLLRTFLNRSEARLESSSLALGIAGVITVVMFLGSLPLLPDGLRRDLRVASFGGNANAMGFFLAVYGVFGLHLLGRKSERLLLLGIPLWGMALLLTASRNSMLLFGVAVTIGLGPRILKALSGRPIFLTAMAFIIVFALTVGGTATGIMTKVTDVVSRYTDDRGYLRMVAIRLVGEHPFMGNDWKEAAAEYNLVSDRFLLDAYGEAQQELSFHNLWLTMGAYLGLPGMVLGILLNLLPIIEILVGMVGVWGNNSHIRPHAFLSVGLLVGLLVSLQFEDGYVMGSFALNLAFWSVYAYIVGCVEELRGCGAPLSLQEGG